MEMPPGWYVILESKEVDTHKPFGFVRFGLDLVAWRSKSGAVVVQRDRCPHRNVKLSLGQVKEDRLICPFHGFQFGPTGHCEFVPELSHAAQGLCVTTFDVVERYGWIWLHWRAAESTQSEIPWFADRPDRLTSHQMSDVWPVHFSRSVENQLDYSHLPFVHRTSIGRFSKVGRTPDGEMSDRGIRYFFESPEKTAIEFLFPNIWLNRISPQYMITLAFVPIDEGTTKLYLQIHRGFLTFPPLSWLMNAIDRLTNRWILGQDRAVVITQGRQSSLESSDVLFPSDRFIKHFRTWLAKKSN